MNRLSLLVIILVFAGCGSYREEQLITVSKKMESSLKDYRMAHIESENANFSDPKLRASDHWASFVELEVSTVLEGHGIKPYVATHAADLRIKAILKSGLGFPRLGRHFDLITEYIDFVNIKLIDAKTDKLIGEVEYNRPFLAKNPPYLIRNMMDALVKSGVNSKGKQESEVRHE